MFQAGDASDLIAQDLLPAQCTQEEADRIFDGDLVSGLRDRLFNQQYWGDEEAWLYNAAWLTLPCHYQATLESVLHEIGIVATPCGRLNSWLLQQGIRNPRDMFRRLGDVHHNVQAANRHDDAELNPRVECLLDNSGFLPELRHAVETGLSTRRRRTPQAQDPREDTCVICWDGIAQDAPDTFTRCPQCGHLVHRACHRATVIGYTRCFP